MPRFQFSLRTLLIVVTLLAIPCGYVGWQAQIVSHRKAMLRRIDVVDSTPNRLSPGLNKVPLIRRWFGDCPVGIILIREGAKPSDVQEIRDAFPEADVMTPLRPITASNREKDTIRESP